MNQERKQDMNLERKQHMTLQAHRLDRHQKTCTGFESRIRYAGGVFETPRSIVEELAAEGMKIKPEYVYPYHIVPLSTLKFIYRKRDFLTQQNTHHTVYTCLNSGKHDINVIKLKLYLIEHLLNEDADSDDEVGACEDEDDGTVRKDPGGPLVVKRNNQYLCLNSGKHDINVIKPRLIEHLLNEDADSDDGVGACEDEDDETLRKDPGGPLVVKRNNQYLCLNSGKHDINVIKPRLIEHLLNEDADSDDEVGACEDEDDETVRKDPGGPLVVKRNNQYLWEVLLVEDFGKQQITLHPIVAYYKNDSFQLVRHALMYISNDIGHDYHIVNCFTEMALTFLRGETEVESVIILRDKKNAPGGEGLGLHNPSKDPSCFCSAGRGKQPHRCTNKLHVGEFTVHNLKLNGNYQSTWLDLTVSCQHLKSLPKILHPSQAVSTMGVREVDYMDGKKKLVFNSLVLEVNEGDKQQLYISCLRPNLRSAHRLGRAAVNNTDDLYTAWLRKMMRSTCLGYNKVWVFPDIRDESLVTQGKTK
ncbi:hypothetical protein EGW08_013531 [Elysia chlorotica]|uniref:Uncharacterized protein n=1 Tax=Elysia chlorotica TaxID=188477 RepID=A0A3S1HG52_ELYCH|nr:hypothetical protein EGW08_013531 [Elysia chlorotica]